MSAPPALSVDALHVRYDDVLALRGVDLVVEAGGCTAVLGPSGCGKSTLLRAVAGLVRTQAGAIEVAGVTTDRSGRSEISPEDRQVALVFQDQALWPHMTVQGNIEFVLEARGVAKRERRDAAAGFCEAVGLPLHFLERSPGVLSGGERQRAALARALAQAPGLLLLDEPLTGLDRHLRGHLLETLAALRIERGLAMLVVTHDQEEAFALADRVAVMRGGRIEQEGTPEEIYASPATAFVADFVGPAALLPADVSGSRATTPLGSFPVAASDRGACTAVFRPESVHVIDADGAACGGRVETCFYRGSHFLLVVSLEDPAHRVLVRSETGFAPGTEIALKADGPALVDSAETVKADRTETP